MKYYTHVAFGLGCYVCAAKLTGLPPAGVGALAAMAGALLPDLDNPQSWIGYRLKIISVPLEKVIGHRAFSHSALATMLFTVALVWAGLENAEVVAGLSIGYLSHLLGDWLNPKGIPFWWPRRKMYASPWAIFSGGPAEATFFGLLVILLLWAYGFLPLGQLAGF